MATLFFYFILIPLINSLLIDGDKIKDLPPEYNEYLKQLGIPSNSRNSSKLYDQPLVNAPLLASLHLCKDSAQKDDLFSIAYCWIVFVVSLLLIVNLIIYQVRSVLKLKKELPVRKGKEDEHKSDQQNFEFQYPNGTSV
jgi:Leucine-rich repeat (LRR) protein